MNEKRIKETAAPFYAQFRALGELYDAESIDKHYFKAASRIFAKQYFWEFNKLKKTEQRLIKWAYKDEKRGAKKERRKREKADRKAAIQAWREALGERVRACWHALLVRLHIHKDEGEPIEETEDTLAVEEAPQQAEGVITEAEETAAETPQEEESGITAEGAETAVEAPQEADSGTEEETDICAEP